MSTGGGFCSEVTTTPDGEADGRRIRTCAGGGDPKLLAGGKREVSASISTVSGGSNNSDVAGGVARSEGGLA